MAAIFLGLFVLALGSTGTSNALSGYENYGWNRRLQPYRYNNFDSRRYRDEMGAPDYPDYRRENGFDYGWNDRLNPFLKHHPWHKNYDFKYNRDQSVSIERFGHRSLRCKNGVCSPPGFQVDGDLELNGIKHLKIMAPKNNKLDGEIPDLKGNTNGNMNIVNSEASFKSTVSSQDNMTKKPIIKLLYGYNRRSSADKSGNPAQPNAKSESNNLSRSSETVNVHMTDEEIPASKISASSIKATTPTRIILNSDITLAKNRNLSKPDSESSSSIKVENFVKNTFSTPMFENSRKYDTMESSIEDKKVRNDTSEFMPNTILKSDLAENSFVDKKKDQNQSTLSSQIFENSHTENTVTSYTERKNIKNNSEFSTDAFTKSEPVGNSFIAKKQERTDESRNDSMVLNPTTLEIEVHNSSKTNSTQGHLLPNEENFEQDSTVFPSTILTGEVSASFGGKSNFPVGTHSRNNQDVKLESTVSQSPPFSTTNEDISLKIKSSASEGVNTRKIENFETKSTASQSSVAFKSDATASQSSSSFAIKSRTLISLKDKVTEDSINKISSAESPFPKTQIKSDGIIEKDHVIEIPSIRTARVVITSMFLMVALIAFAVLSVYMFRLRRREVQYDQVMLIS